MQPQIQWHHESFLQRQSRYPHRHCFRVIQYRYRFLYPGYTYQPRVKATFAQKQEDSSPLYIYDWFSVSCLLREQIPGGLIAWTELAVSAPYDLSLLSLASAILMSSGTWLPSPNSGK
jgi:hypothetical protein